MSAQRRPPKDPPPGCLHATADAVASGIGQRMHVPDDGLGETMVRRAYGDPVHLGEGSLVVGFPPHLRKMFASWSEEDVSRLDKLMKLRPETVAWVESKNTRELERLDGAVEFISSSRTAAKVLMWVCGTAATVVTGSIALAKSGYDLFSLFRGVGK
ncbi:hypothetical protein [Methylobacterium sp. WL8]|uniref:hypothetical protein n=1 Tax=Methylobacterium sp. WL8 TaxID=2603899 RepID=UPI0011CC13FA|nr:hypothetical protein [Methylobacterium sp. WL8]TXN79291.1 hypothetical protein FV234_21025 [Methylobacterium sp. WL8]